jgi:hypothetical protein
MAFDVERDGHPTGIDLLQQGEFFDGHLCAGSKLRGQTYAIPQGGQLAREYHVKMVIDSAFKEFYPEGKTEVRMAGPIVLKKKCTFRPPPPQLAEIETRLYWTDIDESKTVGRRRSSLLRIRLDEKWFVTGRGEKLGIVLCRQSNPSKVSSRFSPYLSVAGSDPTLVSSPVPEYLNSTNFKVIGGQQDLFQEVELFLPEQEEGKDLRNSLSPSSMTEGQEKLTVDILALTPQFSETEGLYCDVQVRLVPNKKFNPYNAFVHLGLVRFQDNAVKHLRASFPLKDPKTKVYMLPDRELRVTGGGFRNRRLDVSGSGYELAQLGDYGRSLPVLDATLMRWNDRVEQWEPIRKILENGQPLVSEEREFMWAEDFRLGDRNRPYVVLVEEFECLPIDKGCDDHGTEAMDALRLVYSCMMKL